MADFKRAFNLTMGAEGGYANDPADHGGETYKGIARNFWPAWEGWKIIDTHKGRSQWEYTLETDQLLQTKVLEFYKKNFWDKMRLDELHDDAIATEMFDTGVNMGNQVAIRFLQRALNVLNKNGTLYPDIVVDGMIGVATITTVNRHPNPKMVYDVLNTLQGARYVELAENDHSQERWMYGWMARVYYSLK